MVRMIRLCMDCGKKLGEIDFPQKEINSKPYTYGLCEHCELARYIDDLYELKKDQFDPEYHKKRLELVNYIIKRQNEIEKGEH